MPFILIESLDVFHVHEGMLAARQFDPAKRIAVPQPPVQKNDSDRYANQRRRNRQFKGKRDINLCQKVKRD